MFGCQTGRSRENRWEVPSAGYFSFISKTKIVVTCDWDEHFFYPFKGNIAAALQYVNELLTILPDNENANRNKMIYENLLKDDTNNQPAGQNAPQPNNKTNETLLYEMLCRKDVGLSAAESSKLKCRYVTNRSPFLKIAPLKLEEAYLEPYIVIYHDVMYDAEIEVLKKMAKPRVCCRRFFKQNKKS